MEHAQHSPACVLRVGDRIGQYEIVSRLGADGTGENWAAIDRNLNREVAVRVLAGASSLLGMSAARALGIVNHPNIVAIYDAGVAEDVSYVVTERLHGETLRDLLARSGRLPLETALGIAMPLARGIAAAHGRGVVHGALSTACVFLVKPTPSDSSPRLSAPSSFDGHVKILPGRPVAFGAGDDTISVDSGPDARLDVSCLSPEQIEGGAPDERSDIFAIGAILYELLTGMPPFGGSSPAATLTAVLEESPPEIRSVRDDVPRDLATAIALCLERRPHRRMQSVRDLLFMLEGAGAGSSSNLRALTRETLRRLAWNVRRRPATSTTAIALSAAAVFVALAAGMTSTEARRLDEPVPAPLRPPEIERISSSGDAGFVAALSPSGSQLVFERGGELVLAHLPSHKETSLIQPEKSDIRLARFTPDGNFVLYVTLHDETQETGVYRVPVLGGAPQLLVRDIGSPWSQVLTIERSGARIAFTREDEKTSSLVVAFADGSSESVLAVREAPSRFHHCAWHPAGVTILCSATIDAGTLALVEVDVTNGAQRLLDDAGLLLTMGSFEWVPDGTAIIGLSGSDSRQQIARVSWPDLESTRLTNDLSSYYSLSIANDGQTVAAIRLDTTTNLWSVATSGEPDLRRLTTGVNTNDGNLGVTTTPDGRIVWASGASGNSVDLMIADGDGAGARRLTFDDEAWETWPDVSPDGRVTVFNHRPSGAMPGGDVWLVHLLDSAASRLTTVGDATGAPAISGDGHWVYFHRLVGEETFAHRVPLDGGEPERVSDEPGMGPRPSPDGRWLMLGTNNGVEVRPTTRGETLVMKGIGGARRWSPDSRAIAYAGAVGGGLNLFVRRLDEDAPRKLTSFPRGDIVAWGFDWTEDGSRILFARRTQARDAVVLRGNL